MPCNNDITIGKNDREKSPIDEEIDSDTRATITLVDITCQKVRSPKVTVGQIQKYGCQVYISIANLKEQLSQAHERGCVEYNRTTEVYKLTDKALNSMPAYLPMPAQRGTIRTTHLTRVAVGTAVPRR